MTDQDYDAFVAEFRRMALAFERYPQATDALRARGDVYFNVLKRFTLQQVIAKADVWIDRETKMPKPAEWAGVVAGVRGSALPEMEHNEAKEWLRAERQHWEDPPCGCNECREAGVQDTPRRFVPIFDHNDREVKALCFGREVVRGEWIHAYPLMRWHIARENFFSLRDSTIKRMEWPKSDAETSRRERQQIAKNLLAKETAINRMLGERD